MTAAVLALALASGFSLADQEPSYESKMADWRQEVAASLLGEQGWLSVAGLVWLHEGFNRVSNITFKRTGAAVSATVDAGVTATVGGKPFESGRLTSDMHRGTTLLSVGTVTYKVIERGKRIGVRVYDSNSKYRRDFSGLNWYPVDSKYRIVAKFVPYRKHRTMPILNVLGDTTDVDVPGYVLFSVNGQPCRLEAEDAGSGLFFNFRDSTSGKTTYGAGRFLDTALPKGGWVELDFNQATNPPCAYTDFATCPLPPKQNYLKVAIPAGEKAYAAHGD